MQGQAVSGFEVLYWGAALCYLAYFLAEWWAVTLRRPLLASGLAVHVLGLLARARAIEWFPLTNKFESFYTFALAVFAVALLVQGSPSRLHRLGLWALGAAFYAWAWSFGTLSVDPPPLMLTPWYPLHVPASFAAYALWSSAAMAGLATLLGDARERLLQVVERHNLWGWGLFSLSMLCGGAWGFVAWGAYFLWDPKVVWSVILWLLYSGLIHLRYWPAANRATPRAALSLVGFVVMLIAYVGTSFLFQHGSHSFG